MTCVELTYGDFAEGPNKQGYLKITRMTSKDFYLTKYDLEKMMKLYDRNSINRKEQNGRNN